jgi:hypothetical protein
MTKWFLFIIGLLLLVSGYCGGYWLSLLPDSLEAEFVLLPQVHIPISQIAEQRKIELNILRNDISPRIRRAWGDPDFVFAALSVDRQLQYCFDSVQVTVLSGPELTDVGRSAAVYGYGPAYDASCHSTGRRFRLPPGEPAYMQLAGATDGMPSDAEIVLIHTWPNTKDKLVGAAIDQDLRKYANGAMVAGIFAIVFSAILFMWPRRKSPASIDALP